MWAPDRIADVREWIKFWSGLGIDDTNRAAHVLARPSVSTGAGSIRASHGCFDNPIDIVGDDTPRTDPGERDLRTGLTACSGHRAGRLLDLRKPSFVVPEPDGCCGSVAHCRFFESGRSVAILHTSPAEIRQCPNSPNSAFLDEISKQQLTKHSGQSTSKSPGAGVGRFPAVDPEPEPQRSTSSSKRKIGNLLSETPVLSYLLLTLTRTSNLPAPR